MTARALSPSARAVLRYVRTYHETYGYSPSLRDIVGAGHASSTSMAIARLSELEACGLIRRRRGIARGITVVREGGAV